MIGSSKQSRSIASPSCETKKQSSSTKRGILKRSSTRTNQDDDTECADYSRKSIGSKSDSFSCSSSVSFDSIMIREYSVTVGDNPSCSCGAPISIDWYYGKQVTIPVEHYEKVKPPRREKDQMRIPSQARIEILQKWDCSIHRISQASEEAQKERELRNKSVKAFARRERLKRGLQGLISYPLVLFEGMCHHQQENKSSSSCASGAGESMADLPSEYQDDDDNNKINEHRPVHYPTKMAQCLKDQEEEPPSNQLAGEVYLYQHAKECHRRTSQREERRRSQHCEKEQVTHHYHHGDRHQNKKDAEHRQKEYDDLSYTHHELDIFLA